MQLATGHVDAFLLSTHIFSNDGAEAGEPQDTRAAHSVDKKSFSAEYCLPQALSLVILNHSLRGRQKGIMANHPALFASHTDADDVS
jgi:hypothetical protein